MRNLCLLLQFGAEYSDVKNTQVRRITAERLLQSKTTIPHYYLTVDLNADKLLELRAQLNEKLAASGGKLSVNDFIVKASALVSYQVVKEVIKFSMSFFSKPCATIASCTMPP